MENNSTNSKDLLPVSIEKEMKGSYLDYAMSVIISRALPDVRDGLKPVHRRILYSMYESGFHHDRPYRKSARIVGDVIGKYHPHGDAAIYDSLVRMAQDFSLREPLVDGQGNFGSIDGDAAAAMRYTESRLSKITSNMLYDLDKDTVNFRGNYDGTEKEPEVLPSVFPNLLVNGSSGIAVGMATNIPSHNLSEVIDACVSYIDNNNITIDEIIEIIPGPDFPTKGIILGKSGIKSAYYTGRGSISIRGKADIEKNDNNKEQIIITEIPYGVNKSKLIEKIAELVKDKKIEGISDIRDESNKEGIRVVIEIKRDGNSDIILNNLYNFSNLQTSFGVNMLALDQGLPRVMNIKEVITSFVNFREEVITKRTIFLLNKARDKAHILIGLSIAVSNIDEVIQTIKSSQSPLEAKEKLMSTSWTSSNVSEYIKLVEDNENIIEDGKCKFTERQAKAILEMRLQRLTAMEQDKIEDDLKNLALDIKEYLKILSSNDYLYSLMKKELIEIKDKFGTKRLTEISDQSSIYDELSLIPKEDMVVTVTLDGYIKRVPLSVYRAQNRGGKGRNSASIKNEDVVTNIFVGNTHAPILFFTSKGQVYSLMLYKLPLGNLTTRGRPIVNLIPISSNETISTVMILPEDVEERENMHIVFATKNGKIRKNALSDFENIQSSGKIAIKLKNNDELVNVSMCDDNNHIFIATKNGKAIRFNSTKLRLFKSRNSDGVRAINLSSNDHVISMTIIQSTEFNNIIRDEFLSIPVKQRIKIAKGKSQVGLLKNSQSINREQVESMSKSEEFIISVSEKGYGKITSAYNYRVSGRGGKGLINLAISSKTGNVAAVLHVNLEDDLMLITNLGKIIRCPVKNIRITGRSASGVTIFKTAADEKIVSAAVVSESSEEEN